jgi:histidinol-phosphate aminotransferase
VKARLPVRKAILKRRTYEAPAEGRANKVRLDFNENTSGCSKAVLRALRNLTPKQIAMYPEYQKPSRTLARYFGVKPEELLLTNGGDDALRVFFDAFVDAGSTVVLVEPTFPMYRYYAEIAGARIHALHYGKQMEFPLRETVAALRKKPRVLFIANPNNPTGTLLREVEMKRILRAATHTAVVFDEAYADFSEISALKWIRRYPQLFIARTFSKTAGLASLRLGAAIGGKESITILRRAMPPFPLNLAALVAAEAAVKDRHAMNGYIRNVRRFRARLASDLERIGVKTYPTSANFLLADFGPTGPVLFQKLERQGILLRERSKDIGAGFVRITIGTDAEMKLLWNSILHHWKRTNG